jgi:bifunctional DNA-binding transcriptional regulator/antitoxin component of YhaV-PrlF toxin-antitoxin module
MPQLVKGGKYVFGRSRISDGGRIAIPPEAINEYKLKPDTKVILMSGSKTSGGFTIAKKSLLEQSEIGGVLAEIPELRDGRIEEGKIIEHKKKKYGWTRIRAQNTIKPGDEALEAFGLKPGDDLLSVRGSYLGIGMINQGPLVKHARTHPEIEHFI